MKRAGRAVELRPAPKARNAAHPQERSLIAGARSTNFRSVLERTAVRDNALAWNSLTA